ncbi:MAG TPA: hypothetical protein VFD70_15895 [Anaerolineae bacterium]|nr:hypothetical protein [Anaerolineae bacterium]
MEAKELNLSIVELDDVLLHEEIEHKRVDKLIERLRGDRILKNPPIVTQVRDAGVTRYIVLDGASRSTALRELNMSHILVQIVDYHSPALKLESWNHLLLDMTPAALRRELDEVSCIGMVEMDEAQAKRELEERKIVAYVKFSDGRTAGLRCSSDITEQAHALNEVVRSYESKVELYRVASTDLENLVADPNRLAAVMVFPRYRPDEIVNLALNGAKVPMGITRHIIPGRALRVNLPLDILESKQSLDEKNKWLDAWLQAKIKNRNVRYYQEPVFLFDE